MKRLLTRNIIFLLFLMMVSACQSDAAVTDTDISSTSDGDTAYPVDQSYPVSSDQTDVFSAYPIPEEHLALLAKTWVLSVRTENGISQEPIEKTLILGENGSYEIITAENTSTGIWTTSTSPSGTTLFLDIGTANVSLYNILEMSENSLRITYQQDGFEVEEQYLPTD